ncbi:hypothetical protein H2200_012760 [Cladophialophora chaetospira]|uniref:Beta-lactamase/transpeptidase-like protein n=1 Tax=Cladophialophora chaetospira TaxID=386627 RepID=A0AA38WXI7_9EURO|nr:hypothetical protein H2200_012760 [Cladophialophora chaetospira]
MSSVDEFFSRYDDLITDAINRYHVPGISIAVVDGESILARGYGLARFPDVKSTAQTLFNGASLTKALVAASISLLVDDDECRPEVQWSTPVSQLLREDFVLSDSRTDLVTIEDILSHRTGLPDQDDACMGIHAEQPDTPRSVTRKLRYLPLTAPLRTSFQYCNMMYVVAVHLVETLTGLSMGDYLRRTISGPLGMSNSHLGHDEVITHGALDELAKGYGWDDDKLEYFEIDWPIQPEAVGAGEIISTATDFACFLRCMIHKTMPISAEGHDELVKPRTIVPERPSPFRSQQLYALGWLTSTYHGESIIDHSGGTSGFGSHMIYLPKQHWGLVILGNAMESSRAINKIMWTMVDDLLRVPKEKRFDWDRHRVEDWTEWRLKAYKELYPKTPNPPIPLTLPLPAYAGSYQHKGYGALTVNMRDAKLEIDAMDRTYRFKLFLTHISGEFFVAERRDVDSRDKEIVQAAFRLNVDGAVAYFGVALIPGRDKELIWFRRVLRQVPRAGFEVLLTEPRPS